MSVMVLCQVRLGSFLLKPAYDRAYAIVAFKRNRICGAPHTYFGYKANGIRTESTQTSLYLSSVKTELFDDLTITTY